MLLVWGFSLALALQLASLLWSGKARSVVARLQPIHQGKASLRTCEQGAPAVSAVLGGIVLILLLSASQ